MVENPFEGGFDFFVQHGGSDLAAKNMFYGFPNQGSFRPAQEIVEPAQDPDIASGDREGQIAEQEAVQFHLHKFAQAQRDFRNPKSCEKHNQTPQRKLSKSFKILTLEQN